MGRAERSLNVFCAVIQGLADLVGKDLAYAAQVAAEALAVFLHDFVADLCDVRVEQRIGFAEVDKFHMLNFFGVSAAVTDKMYVDVIHFVALGRVLLEIGLDYRV